MFCKSVLILIVIIGQNLIRAQKSCGIPGQTTSFIINGTDAKRGAWPWIASLHRSSDDQFLCGGTFIGSKFVVTAAHCIQNKNPDKEIKPKHPSELIVKLGKYDLSKLNERGSVVSYVNEIVIHPEWKPHEPKYNGDIAIIILDDIIQITARIFPICLRSNENSPMVNKGIVVGWGKSESEAAHENTPKQLEVIIKTNEACFLKNPRFASISSSTTFCAAKDASSGPCTGDSGSGLFVKVGSGTSARFYLQGIVSAGISNDLGLCDVSVDVIYTNAVKVSSWINQVTNSKETSNLPSPAPTSTTSRSKEIFCFFEAWAEGRNGQGAFTLRDLKPELCTTLVFLHAEMENDNLKSINPVQQLDGPGNQRLYRRFTNLKKKHPHLRTLLSVGSWNEGSLKYSELAADPSRRSRFAENSAKFLKNYGFDGLHFHWEYPAHQGGAPEDKENFVDLLQDIRNVYSSQNLYLSAFLRTQTEIVNLAYDIRKIGQIVDAILMMTFDFSGAWDNVIEYPAALSGTGEKNVKSRVDYFISQGAPAEKLILGIPFHGRTFLTKEDGNVGDETSSNVGFNGPFSIQDSLLGFNEFCYWKDKAWTFDFNKHASQAIAKFTSNGVKNVVIYDSPRSVANKVKYVKEKNLGGVWTWFVDTDDVHGNCELDDTAFADYPQELNRPQRIERDYPLLRTINEAFDILKVNDVDKGDWRATGRK